MVRVDGGELGKIMGSRAELLTQTLPPFVSMVISLHSGHFFEKTKL
jgi:hypothetical protein